MKNKPTYEDLEKRIEQLELEARNRLRFEEINKTLFKIATAVNFTSSLDELFFSIHQALSCIIDTTNFYIALYDKTTDRLQFPYIVDTVDESYPTVLEVSKTASLTAEVIRTGQPLMITKPEILAQREKSLLEIPQCTLSEVWLGVPLIRQNEVIGVMTVQNYLDATCYDQTDLGVMVATADQVALALDCKYAEEKLQQSEEQFRTIVSTAYEGILSLSADWKVLYANTHMAQMFGFDDPIDLRGRSFDEFLLEEDLDDFNKNRMERIQGVDNCFERRFKTRDGQIIWTIVSAKALIDENGNFTGSFGMITDITARKKAEEALSLKITELNNALDQIKTLRGIVPICMNCKKVRDDQGYWNQVEIYVRDHTEAEFSHGLCPECVSKVYPEFE